MTTMNKGCILILEGADCAGKSTLAATLGQLAIGEGTDFLYLHGSPWPGTVAAEHSRMQAQAEAASHRAVVVIDHFWVAEQLYGQEYRGEAAYDPARLDEAMQAAGAMLVLCVPTDLDAQARRHAQRRAQGLEHFEQARGVIVRYADLWHGNLAHPGDSYLGRYTRHQDFSLRPDVRRYDMDRNPPAPIVYARALLGLARRQQ